MKKLVFITGISGVGKSTICEYIKNNNMLDNYDVFDIDDLENVNDYNSNTYNLFYENAIKKAVIKSEDKNIVMASSINVTDIEKINIPRDIKAISMIAITCSDDEIYKRLRNRDPRRNCGSDKFINNQLKYQNWIIEHIDLYQFHVDNTNNKIEKTANNIVDYINNL